MTPQQAVALAVDALKKERQRVAFDANTHDQWGVDTPHAAHSSAKRRRINEAIDVLNAMTAEGRCPNPTRG